MHPDTARRGQLLSLAVGFLGLELPGAAMPALHAYLDSWRGMDLIERGLERQGRDLSLTRYGDRWGATIFVTGKEHAVVQGSGWQATPWTAVQQAAFQALHRGGYWSDDPQVV